LRQASRLTSGNEAGALRRLDENGLAAMTEAVSLALQHVDGGATVPGLDALIFTTTDLVRASTVVLAACGVGGAPEAEAVPGAEAPVGEAAAQTIDGAQPAAA
jgi:hypothetical protein